MSKPFVPYSFQERIIDEMSSKEYFGCFAFPGSGKTAITLSVVYNIRRPTLVIAPLSILYTTWVSEHEKWTQFNNLKLSVLHGKDKEQNFYKPAGIYLINPEGLPWLLEMIKNSRRFPFEILVIDESSKFKNHKSKRFKALQKLLRSFSRRYILTGNPIPNHFMDIFAQILILDLGKRLGSSYYRFRNQFFYPTDYMQFNWELKPKAKEEIIEKIADITSFIGVGDVALDLPQRIEVDVHIKLPDHARELYNSMEKKLFSDLDSEGLKVLAPTKATAMMKCWQISQGFLYYYEESDVNKENRMTQGIHEASIEMIKEKVDEMAGQPCCIAYQFQEDLIRLSRAFPKAAILGAGVTGEDVKRIQDNWNEDKIPILLGQLGKISHGLNLQFGSGKTIMLYSLTYNFDTYDQLIRRFERQGAKYDHVMVMRFVVQDTVAEAMLSSINRKESTTEDFYESLTEYRRKKYGRN